MAMNITTSYSGEVLQQFLVRAMTGNELVEKGLIKIEPNIKSKFFIPRISIGKVLQKRVEMPAGANSKGDFDIDERLLDPNEFMAYTRFNPRSFENFWKKWQPQGELVFTELPPDAQVAFLNELSKAVNFELGWHMINGEYVAGSDDMKLFNGILKRIVDDLETIKIAAPVAITQTNVIEILSKVFAKIPKAIRNHPNLRILMAIEDLDKYDDAITALTSKGVDPTGRNVERFKRVQIEALANMPEHVIVATIASSNLDSNLWLGVGDIDDNTTVLIDKVANDGELYFFKMLMKADTNTMWGQNTVLYDARA